MSDTRHDDRHPLAPRTPAELDGTWIPVAADVSGQALLIEELRVGRFVLDRGEYEIFDRAERVVDRGDFRVDDAQEPPAMDIVGVDGPGAGRTLLAIYQLEGDRLVVCYDLEIGTRPLTMQAQPDQLLLRLTYERSRVLS